MCHCAYAGRKIDGKHTCACLLDLGKGSMATSRARLLGQAPFLANFARRIQMRFGFEVYLCSRSQLPPIRKSCSCLKSSEGTRLRVTVGAVTTLLLLLNVSCRKHKMFFYWHRGFVAPFRSKSYGTPPCLIYIPMVLVLLLEALSFPSSFPLTVLLKSYASTLVAAPLCCSKSLCRGERTSFSEPFNRHNLGLSCPSRYHTWSSDADLVSLFLI